MTNQTVLLDVADGIAIVTLNRPEVYNALDLSMAQSLVSVIQECMLAEAVRVVILTGKGRGFCAGGDMKAAWDHIQAGGDPRCFFRDLTVPLHRLISDMRLMEKPIIAAINGAAGGAGISLAAACDIRVAAESSKFKQAYTSIGLVPDGGWTTFVPRLIGPAKATELLLLDPVLDADQALNIGLVHEVVQDEKLIDKALVMATKLANGPATALGGAKSLVNKAVYSRLEEQLELERQRIIAQGGTTDFMEGLSAFIHKREPHPRYAMKDEVQSQEAPETI